MLCAGVERRLSGRNDRASINFESTSPKVKTLYLARHHSQLWLELFIRLSQDCDETLTGACASGVIAPLVHLVLHGRQPEGSLGE